MPSWFVVAFWVEGPSGFKTKGAPRKGKEPLTGSQCEVPTERRWCAGCGVPGHTKSTCTWQRDHGGPGTEGGTVPCFVDSSSGLRSGPSTTPKTKPAAKGEVYAFRKYCWYYKERLDTW
ncbi:hypothetical protein AHAS_Ahas17G0256200 [Arachis hypogaea]